MALDFSTYPPKGHQERIAAYLRFEKLFLGQHKDLYLASPGRYQMPMLSRLGTPPERLRLTVLLVTRSVT